MRRDKLNHLYELYKSNPTMHEGELLGEVIKTAAAITRDDDVAQECAIEVWQYLKDHEVVRFSGWLHMTLRWVRYDSMRKNASLNYREMQPPTIMSEDGDPLTDEEALDVLAFAHEQRSPKLPEVTFSDIEDPFVRLAAKFLHCGYTQEETSYLLGVSADALESRLRRWKNKNN